MFERIIRHLLPSGRAWRLFPGKQITALVEGLASVGPAFKEHIDKVYLDVYPATTRQLREWERQFGLRPGNLTDAERRERLRGEWSATGGQSPRYIQNTLRSAGFDVYVYEWWIDEAQVSPVHGVGFDGVLALDDGTVLSITPTTEQHPARNPRAALGSVSSLRLGTFRLGELQSTYSFLQATGSDSVIALDDGTVVEVIPFGQITYVPDVRLGKRSADGYMLVNRSLDNPVYPDPPTTSEGKRYVAYIGGTPFGEPAQIPASRREDFEALLLKICPTYQWLGIIVQYT